MIEIQAFVKKAKIYLNKGMLDDFGYLIGESWQKKKELSNNISSTKIDHIYSLAMKNGALGGKVLGAGGGGMMVFYVNDTDYEKFKKALSKYLIIPIKFENSGSKIIFNSNKTNIYE